MSGLPWIIKSKGEKKLFSSNKIRKSLRSVGVSFPLAKKITETLEKEAYSGIKTSDISNRIGEMLSKEDFSSAIRFRLKDGIRKLGPTGFPFEKYIGEILLKNGFKIKLNQHISGVCAHYEIDFLAEKGDILYIGECKFRYSAGDKVNLKVALANYARFLDLKKKFCFEKQNRFKNLKIKSILITNTKFTSQVTRYSKCVNVDILGWKYPKNRGLEKLIEKDKLYPITILPSFRSGLTGIFASEKMMLAKDILKINPIKFAKKSGVPLNKIKVLIREANFLFS